MSTAAQVPNSAPAGAGSTPGGTSGGGTSADADFMDFAIATLESEGGPSVEAQPGGAETETRVADTTGAGPNEDADVTKDTAGGPKAGEKEVAAAGAAQVDEWAVPESLTQLAKSSADLQKLLENYGKLNGYRDSWSLDEAKEIRSLAPGGMEELRGHIQAGREAKAENAEFASGDVGRQTTALRGLAADLGEAYVAGAKPYLSVLKEVNPQAYDSLRSEIATEVLTAEGLPGLLSGHLAAVDALKAAADADDEKAFERAFAEVIGATQFREWAGKAGIKAQATGAAPAKIKGTPREQELEAELGKYKANETKQQETQRQALLQEWNGWTKGVDKGLDTAAKGEIAKLLDERIPKNMGAVYRETLIGSIQKEILEELWKQVNADTDLTGRTQAITNALGWKNNPQAKEQVHNLRWGRAQQILKNPPKAIADIISKFSSGAVAAANSRSERDSRSSGRTEVAGTGAVSQEKKPLPQRIQERQKQLGRRLSDEEIMDL